MHGIAGIGKSTLLAAFAERLRERGVTVVRIDCASIEPTERGFTAALRTAVGAEPEIDPLARIESLHAPAVLLVDTYEAFRISDAWFRQRLLSGLPASTRVVLAGTEAPSLAWFGALGWSGALSVLELGPLDDAAAAGFLRDAGLTTEQAKQINRVARGHPLALRVAAATAAGPMPATGLEAMAAHRVVEALTGRYVGQLDPMTRRALDAASVVRRATLSLMGAMLPDAAPQDAQERLLTLPFVRSTADGLALHGTLQQAIASHLRSEDPARHRGYRQSAWRQLRDEVRLAGREELWRYTADMLYLIENPLVREAFFPVTTQLHTVEAAQAGDGPAILETIARHDGPEAAALGAAWWQRAPGTFRVARDREGHVAGFYQIFEAGSLGARPYPKDPVVSAWLDHLRREPVRRGERVLFSRRMLDRERGEAPCPVQAAIFLDVKRLYMEMRPRLRRIYWGAHSALEVMPVLAPLGFVHLPDMAVSLDGRGFPTVMLDFGPGSVDGWLARVAATELGLPRDDLVDLEARELLIDGKRVPLTKLEFTLLRYLMDREGKAVSRADLLQEVWGYSYAGDSNVAEVAVRGLRRKLDHHASVIETVRGTGYLYRRG